MTMPDSFTLVLPEEWEDIPLEPAEYLRHVSLHVERLKNDGLLGRSEIRQYEMLSVAVHRILREQRVILASAFFAIEEGSQNDDDTEVSKALLMASLVMSVARREDFGTDAPLRAELIVKAFTEGSRSEDSGVRYDTIEPPQLCEIAGSQAAKLVRLMTAETSPGEEFKQFSQSYLIPVAEGDAVLVMQFTTINFTFARQFSELFDKIVQTLRLLYPDDSTLSGTLKNDSLGQD